MRLFVAADVPDAAREAIAAEQKRLASVIGGSAGSLRWMRPDHSHLTLVFLGDVGDAHVQAVAEAIGRGVDAPAFDIVFEGVGAFPPQGAPRVLWIGVGDGATPLIALQREFANRMSALGLPLEDRGFHPHLTLARWRDSRPGDRARALAHARQGAMARARIAGSTLYQSRLSSSGPSYTVLARATLTPRLEPPHR
jgi:2'-5' RNA ligase